MRIAQANNLSMVNTNSHQKACSIYGDLDMNLMFFG